MTVIDHKKIADHAKENRWSAAAVGSAVDRADRGILIYRVGVVVEDRAESRVA